jgi:hypothetical protein
MEKSGKNDRKNHHHKQNQENNQMKNHRLISCALRHIKKFPVPGYNFLQHPAIKQTRAK